MIHFKIIAYSTFRDSLEKELNLLQKDFSSGDIAERGKITIYQGPSGLLELLKNFDSGEKVWASIFDVIQTNRGIIGASIVNGIFQLIPFLYSSLDTDSFRSHGETMNGCPESYGQGACLHLNDVAYGILGILVGLLGGTADQFFSNPSMPFKSTTVLKVVNEDTDFEEIKRQLEEDSDIKEIALMFKPKGSSKLDADALTKMKDLLVTLSELQRKPNNEALMGKKVRLWIDPQLPSYLLDCE